MLHSIHPNMIPMRDISQFSDGDRLFYEVGRKMDPEGGYGYNWIKTGQFQEIENPKDFLRDDKLLSQIDYLEHHNFMLLKKNMMGAENKLIAIQQKDNDGIACYVMVFDSIDKFIEKMTRNNKEDYHYKSELKSDSLTLEHYYGDFLFEKARYSYEEVVLNKGVAWFK